MNDGRRIEIESTGSWKYVKNEIIRFKFETSFFYKVNPNEKNSWLKRGKFVEQDMKYFL